jgi:hypothetical protein
MLFREIEGVCCGECAKHFGVHRLAEVPLGFGVVLED